MTFRLIKPQSRYHRAGNRLGRSIVELESRNFNVSNTRGLSGGSRRDQL